MNHRKSKMGQSRDLGMSTNGKGSASRITNQSAYAENFSGIDWGHTPKTDTFVENVGEWGPPSATPITNDLDPE